MTDDKLTPAQRVALEWLPADGAWRRDIHNAQSSALEYLERKGLIVEIGQADRENFWLDDDQGWVWRITPLGEAMRKEIAGT